MSSQEGFDYMELRNQVNDVVSSTPEPSIKCLSARISKQNPPCIFGAFAKLQKATISFVESVSPSVCPHGTAHLPIGRIFV